MANEWTSTALAEFSSDVSYGYTESACSEKVGPHFLRITDIQNGTVNWAEVPYCPITREHHEKYKLSDGDIVIARTGNSTGENYLYQGHEDAVFASYLIRFRIDQQKADPKFVWYNLRTRDWWNFINNSKTGSAQAGANAKVLGRFLINCPSISEQRAIAHILGTLDDKIELNRRANETLEAMARTLFKAWFVDFEPVRAKMEGRWQRGQSQPGLPAHLYDLFPDRLVESELGEIPDGWKYAPLRELASTISKGTTPTKDALNNASDTNVTYFLKVRDITESGEIARNSLELIPISIHENALKRSILRTDDLLFSIAGTIGRVAIVDEDLNNSNCNQAIAFIRLKDKKNFQSLCWFTLRSKRTQDFVESKIVHGVQANASLATIGEIPVLVPNDGVLPAWNEFVRPLMQELKANQSQSRIVTRLRDALLPKLISGDLRVPDAERIVGATV